MNVSKEKFFESIGMTYGNFKGKSKNTPINSNALADILSNYPYINPEWLVIGKGEMILDDEKELTYSEPVKSKSIPLIPLEEVRKQERDGRQILDYDISNGYKIPDLEGKGVKYLIRVSGSSMYPKYSNGDLLACKPLENTAFFQWGKPYVLDTEQGVIVKRLFPCAEDVEHLECHSDNKDHYPPFKIPKAAVKSFAIVVGVVRLE